MATALQKADPNLTPLLDVVFQLITFFMLLINFSSDNFDQRVRLPVAGTARPIDDADKIAEDRLVLNVVRLEQNGTTRFYVLFNGENLSIADAVTMIKRQGDLVKLNLKAVGRKPGENGALPTTIVLRADRDTPFTMIYSVVTACQANGFFKFVLKAMSGP
jgi:biopolymer transport protein ExbD